MQFAFNRIEIIFSSKPIGVFSSIICDLTINESVAATITALLSAAIPMMEPDPARGTDPGPDSGAGRGRNPLPGGFGRRFHSGRAAPLPSRPSPSGGKRATV